MKSHHPVKTGRWSGKKQTKGFANASATVHFREFHACFSLAFAIFRQTAKSDTTCDRAPRSPLPIRCQADNRLLLFSLVLFGSPDASLVMACASVSAFGLTFNAYIGHAYDYFHDHGSLHRCRRIPTRRKKAGAFG